MVRRLLISIAVVLLTCLVNAQGKVGANYAQPTDTNLTETTLTVANVNARQFGKLYSYRVDGRVSAQPLYVAGVPIDGRPRNVLYVATMNDKVYAIDADAPSATPLWATDLASVPAATPVPVADLVTGSLDLDGNVGIESTPVIDAATGTMYLVARTKESGQYIQRLHALDIRTGRARSRSPVRITGSVAGTAADSTVGASGPVVTFDPKMQAQRAALALSNGVVLIAWTPHDDISASHGWLMGYDATSLARVGIFCVSPDGYGGGIWQAGRPPAIDTEGNAFFATGAGPLDGTRNFGNSLLKFSVNRTGIALLDYFTPGQAGTIHAGDPSRPSVTLLPVPTQTSQLVRGPVSWNSPTAGPLVYDWASDDVLKAYSLAGGRLVARAYVEGPDLSPTEPGGSLALSANSSAAGTGIVWASMPLGDHGVDGQVAGILRAYDAETLTALWTSEQNPARDRAGMLMKFVSPLVAAGRVYLPSGNGSVAVYGLLSATALEPGETFSAASGPSAVGGGAIGINFVGLSPTPMGAGETAGVVAKPNWNNATGAARSTPMALMDESGTPTDATVTWSSSGGWMTPITDSPGNARLMKGYLDTTNTSTTTVTVSGLAQASYDVYVYADGDNRGYNRSAAYTISAPGATTATVNLTDPANMNFGATFTRAVNSSGNYVKFSITATTFTLTGTPTQPATSTRRAPINGIQIVPTPPAAADFTIAATPASRTVAAGGSTSYTATISALNGFTGTVALSITGAPAATTTSFTPASVSGSGTATVNVTTSSGTPVGSSTLTITGTSGQLSHSATVVLVIAATPSIGIDFIGSSQATMAAGESAGVVPRTHWNTAAGAARTTPLTLIDSSGAATNATVTWTANNVWMTPITDQPGNARLMKGYLDTSNTSVTTVTVSGLPSGSYDVFVYADGDNAYTRSAEYRISGTGITATTINLSDVANTHFSGTFTQASGTSGNYVKFNITAAGFTLTATPLANTNTTRRAPVNAIQIVAAAATTPVALDKPITVQGIGAGQGVEARDGRVYLYGDAATGVIREYDVVDNSALTFTGRQVLLTTGTQDLLPHPTGFTVGPDLTTLVGNTVSEKGTIFRIDWARALANGTLDGAVLATIADDLAVNGTRPEFVRVGERWLVATADYGALGNEVRLYDPERLKTAARTSEPGVLVYRFRCSPYVQTLHWLDSSGLLVLVQNKQSGQGWRLTVVDLARSIEAGQEVVTLTTDLAPASELEGFHMVAPDRGLFVTSASVSNVYFANVRLF